MKKRNWIVVWIVQLLLMLVLGIVTAAAVLLGPVLESLFAWGIMPLAGLVTAYLATRLGLNNYIAWIAPPVCMWLGFWIFIGYTAHFGPTICCAIISLIGAAAGEVANEREARK